MVTRYQPNEQSFVEWSRHFSTVQLDLGTGDGTFVIRQARSNPGIGIVGVDTCIDHLRGTRRLYPQNARFLRGDARTLPEHFAGTFTRVTVNFPFGSLLVAILDNSAGFQEEVRRITQSESEFRVMINESALADQHLVFEEGMKLIAGFAERMAGFNGTTGLLSASDLRDFLSTWSKKLGYGRNTRAVLLIAHRR